MVLQPLVLVLQCGFASISRGELSLTQLFLMCGWVNPFLSGAHAAPVHHCFTQNTRVHLCSTAGRQYERKQNTKKWLFTHKQRDVVLLCPLQAFQSQSGTFHCSLSCVFAQGEEIRCCLTLSSLRELFKQDIPDSCHLAWHTENKLVLLKISKKNNLDRKSEVIEECMFSGCRWNLITTHTLGGNGSAQSQFHSQSLLVPHLTNRL